jgi:mono/diheme cytochrome c family protein
MTQKKRGAGSVVFMGILVSGLLWLWAGNSLAQEKEVSTAGQNVFNQNCAVCHGREGKGDGVAASMLTVKPADLTQIAKKNGGEFPFWKIYGVIDGRQDVKAHGTRDMPIWGEEFRLQAGTSVAAESQVRGRILELVYYLQSIQAQ